jgi:outer membrane protein
MKKISIFINCLFFLTPSALYATTLEEALVFAYTGNFALESQREELKRIDHEMYNAFSGFLPTLTFTSLNRADRSDKDIYGKALNGKIYKIKKYTDSFQLEQNLFNGGATLGSIEAAKYKILAERAKLIATEQKVLESAVDVYLDVILYRRILEASNENVNNLSKSYASTKDRFAAGVITRTDVAKAEANLSNAITERINVSANYESAVAQYFSAIGVEAENVVEPTDPKGLPDSYNNLLEESLRGNPSLNAAKLVFKQAKAIEKTSGSALWPQVKFTAHLSRVKQKNSLSGTKVGSSVNNTLGASIDISIPIVASGSTYTSIRQSMNEASKARLNLRAYESKVREDAIRMWTGYEAAKSAVVSARNTVEASKITLEGMMQEYEEGLRPLFEVLTAENELYKSKVQYLKAEKDQDLMAYRVLSVMGKLTAEGLELPTKIYNPEDHYEMTIFKLIGF